jgi:hypothetical protein
VLLLLSTQVYGVTPRQFFPASLSYSWPGGGLSKNVGARPAIGFSLGYLLAIDRNFRIGIRGTWSRMVLGKKDTVDYSQYGLTHIGLTTVIQYKLFKYGITPYAELEGGMGYLFADELIANMPVLINDLTIVKLSAAVAIGILIPVNEGVDIDVSGRYCITAVPNGFSTLAAHVGATFALN